MMKYDTIVIGDPSDEEAPREAFPFVDDAAEPAFRDWYAKQSGDGAGYGRACFVYATRWARAMENALDGIEAPTMEDVARVQDASSHEADRTEGMGITGYMHGMAVQIIARYWRFGEHLRRAFNREYNRADLDDKPGASVNPAVLTFSV